MRFVFSILMVVALSCDKKAPQEQPTEQTPSTAKAPSEGTNTEPAPPAPSDDVAFDCDAWDLSSLVEQACGEAMTLTTPSIGPDPSMGCRRFGKGKSGSTVDILIGKRAGSAAELYPEEPVSKVEGKRRTTRMGAAAFTITIKEQPSGDAAPYVCEEPAAKALATAIAGALAAQ